MFPKDYVNELCKYNVDNVEDPERKKYDKKPTDKTIFKEKTNSSENKATLL